MQLIQLGKFSHQPQDTFKLIICSSSALTGSSKSRCSVPFESLEVITVSRSSKTSVFTCNPSYKIGL